MFGVGGVGIGGSTTAVGELWNRLYDMSRPQFVNNVWRRPQLSRRKLADMRKDFLKKGVGWDARLDWYKTKPEDKKPERPLKGRHHKELKEKELRRKKVAENLLKEPKVLDDFRNNLKQEKLKVKKPIDFLYEIGTEKKAQTPQEKEFMRRKLEKKKKKKAKFEPATWAKTVKERVKKAIDEGRF